MTSRASTCCRSPLWLRHGLPRNTRRRVHFGFVERLVGQQLRDDTVELVAVVPYQFPCLGVALVDDPADLTVHDAKHCVGYPGHVRVTLLRQHRHRADVVGHTPPTDYAAGGARGVLQVALRTGGHHTEDLLFGRHSPDGPNDAPPQVLFAVDVSVVLRGGQGDTEGVTARNDRHLAHRVGAGLQHPEQRVSGLVVGGAATLLFWHHHVAGGAELYLLKGVDQVLVGDVGLPVAGRSQRRLVDKVGQVRASHARRRGRELVEIHVVGKRHLAGVHSQDRGAALAVWRVDSDRAVEPARPQQRRIEDVGAVRRGQHHDTLRPREPIHFGEDLVKRLFPFVVTTDGDCASA